jgi:asparagine synthase (glutamine-hydrolysing)
MCGIAGSFNWPEADLSAMVRAMHHRGPDDRGAFRDGPCAIGMSRLAIIDTSMAGHQPMLWKDEVALVFNGEIYNHAELRAGLVARGRHFASESDTEVILQLYLEEGDAAIQRLRGMFALAIYDRRKGPGRETLLLARDPFGIKPLLIARQGHRLVFASEIRSLLASGVVRPQLDPAAVRQLLMRGAVVQPRTMLAGVAMLMPATLMRVTASGVEQEPYWSAGTGRRSDVAAAGYADQVDILARELDRAVSEQMVADVPLGAFLSGGLDSSIIVGLMARHAGVVRTFSVGFGEDGQDLDETEDAMAVANALGTSHQRVEISDTFVAAQLERFAEEIDQPSVDGLNSWLVSGAAAPHVKVALSGTGGDELFAGYPWFAAMRQDPFGTPAPPTPLRRFARFLSRREADAVPNPFVARFAAEYRHFDPTAAARMLGSSPQDMERADVADMEPADSLAGSGPLDRTSVLCLGTYTLNQLLRDIDATSMAHSLEVRVPFLDTNLLDFALSLPETARLAEPDGVAEPGSYRALGTKRILLDVARRIVPLDLGSRAKRGFSMPLDRWLRGPMRAPLEESLRAPHEAVAGLLNAHATAAVLDDFLAERIHWGRPWILQMLDRWSRHMLSAAPAPASRCEPLAFSSFH